VLDTPACWQAGLGRQVDLPDSGLPTAGRLNGLPAYGSAGGDQGRHDKLVYA